MKKLLTVITMALASVLVAQDKTMSSADARGKIGDIIDNPASMTSVMKQLAASDQASFLADVNAAIAMGCLSYLVIFFGGLIRRGGKGAGAALKEFSLPISMSFRLFGALLSGLLVTELVYHYVRLSYVLPVVVGVLFTLLHALVQAYVLTMLVGMYYGEVTGREEESE